MNCLPFEVKYKDRIINGDYCGNLDSHKVILFSHGLGVDRDDRGLFDSIINALLPYYTFVRFDYNFLDLEKKIRYAPSFQKGAKILNSVLAYVKLKFQPEELNIIAHSMGTGIVGFANPIDIKRIILLASYPLNIFPYVYDYFSKRPNTTTWKQKELILKHSDGWQTHVSKEFWDEIKEINMIDFSDKLSSNSMVYYIRPKDDEIFKNANFDDIKNLNNINYLELPGDHNFSAESRQVLIKTIRKILQN